MSPIGHPTARTPDHGALARNHCRRGNTTAELAAFFGAWPRTIDNRIVGVSGSDDVVFDAVPSMAREGARSHAVEPACHVMVDGGSSAAQIAQIAEIPRTSEKRASDDGRDASSQIAEISEIDPRAREQRTTKSKTTFGNFGNFGNSPSHHFLEGATRSSPRWRLRRNVSVVGSDALMTASPMSAGRTEGKGGERGRQKGQKGQKPGSSRILPWFFQRLFSGQKLAETARNSPCWQRERGEMSRIWTALA